MEGSGLLIQGKILNQFAHEYYQNALFPEKNPAEPSLHGTLSIDEWREALHACKGLPLHVEVDSKDLNDYSWNQSTIRKNITGPSST